MSILAIVALSLISGLIIGAGVNADMILPVAACTAAVLFVNRNKIAARASEQTPIDAQSCDLPVENCHTWPALNRFGHTVAGECYRDAINRLMPESSAGNTAWKAYLIPEHDNPYDSKAVRIDINRRTVARLSLEESRSFRHRLAENGLTDQITACNATIVSGENNARYTIHLDIEPLAFYELPWIAG